MSHTPFGYRIENGKAVIDIEAAEQIKILFESYLSGDSLATAAKKAGMTDMSTFLKKQPASLTEYDEQLVRRLIEKVTVYEDKFTVEFKSGVSVDINA